MRLAPRITQRPASSLILDKARDLGYTPLQAQVIAGRFRDSQANGLNALLRPSVAELDAPDSLPAIGPAVETLARAIRESRDIAVCVDYDVDGLTSGATLVNALRRFGHPRERIRPFIGIRARNGYGLSEGLADAIEEQTPPGTVVLTADIGSSDAVRIERLAASHRPVVVTDHHSLAGTLGPEAAVAVVNPARPDSAFPDPYVCGAHVAWLVAAALRQQLIDDRIIPSDTPKLGDLLDFVGLGAAADCTDLSLSSNNRAVILRALALMNRPGRRTCWAALNHAAGVSGQVASSTLGFTYGPALNSRGRLGAAHTALDFLLEEDPIRARAGAEDLFAYNLKRREIQQAMVERCMPMAEAYFAADARGMTIHDPQGFAGVQGIVASRLVEAFGCPVACFSPKSEGVLTASLRSIPACNVYEALREVAARLGDGMLAFGGHSGAAGASIREDHIVRFRESFDAACARQLGKAYRPGPVLLTDGELSEVASLATWNEIQGLAPFGRAFEAPLFEVRGRCVGLRQVGGAGEHLQVKLVHRGVLQQGIWFGATRDGPPAIRVDDPVRAAVELDKNTFRDQSKLQFLIRHAEID